MGKLERVDTSLISVVAIDVAAAAAATAAASSAAAAAAASSVAAGAAATAAMTDKTDLRHRGGSKKWEILFLYEILLLVLASQALKEHRQNLIVQQLK